MNNQKQKICILGNSDPIVWAHNNNFIERIEESYFLLEEEFEISYIKFPVVKELSEDYLKDKALEINKENPDKIVFLGVYIDLIRIIEYLDLPNCEYYIHVYGNIACGLSRWVLLEKFLKGKKITMIACSTSLGLFTKKLFDISINVQRSPYLLRDPNGFYFDRQAREDLRNKYNIGDSLAFVYSGRFSYQKNIDQLILAYKKYHESIDHPTKLVIVAKYDNFFIPSFDAERCIQRLGFKSRFLKWYEDLEGDFKKDIIFIEDAKQDEIYKYYCMGDIFISLSTFYWEDFGLSIEEALCCGLPFIATDWGGYRDFYKSPFGNFQKVGVVDGSSPEFRHLPNLDDLEEMLRNSKEMVHSIDEREQLSKKNNRLFSTKSVAENLKKILKEETKVLDRFGNGFFRHLERVNKIPEYKAPYLEHLKYINSLYKDLLAETYY